MAVTQGERESFWFEALPGGVKGCHWKGRRKILERREAALKSAIFPKSLADIFEFCIHGKATGSQGKAASGRRQN